MEDNKDLELLIGKLKGIVEGDFTFAKKDDFENPEAAEAFNAMIDSFMKRNNHFLMRINDAMTRIADNSCVKTMLDEIDKQKDPIKVLRGATDSFRDSRGVNLEKGTRVYALIKQIKCAMDECALQCEDIVNQLQTALEDGGISEDAREVVELLISNLGELRQDLSTTHLCVKDVEKDISGMYSITADQTSQYELMFGAISSITESFNTMYSDCMYVGNHLYRISRDIDNARNDMFRKNSWPLLHDKLKVFSVDHMTLSWRLYNHVVEYENLRIAQVNNPEGCKFGVWAGKEIERGSDISKSEAFMDAFAAHKDFHEHALACFLLKESYKNNEAIAEFQEVLSCNDRFQEAMERLHIFLNGLGIMDQTEVWKFEEDGNIRMKL